MLQWKLLKRNPNTNTDVYFAEEGDKVHVRHVPISTSPMIAVYKDNEKQRDKNLRYGEGAVSARIDAFTMNELMLSGAAHDSDYMKKFLNKNENKHMRTTKGNI